MAVEPLDLKALRHALGPLAALAGVDVPALPMQKAA